MKKSIVLIIVVLLTLLSVNVYAESTDNSFIINGPTSLLPGETGTYIVNVNIKDAAGAQATLQYDDTMFDLVSGELTGVWDAENNQDKNIELIKVDLKAKDNIENKKDVTLNLFEYKIARLTGGVPPVEDIETDGANLIVQINPLINEPVENSIQQPDNQENKTVADLKTLNNNQSNNIKNDNTIFIIVLVVLLTILIVLFTILIKRNRNMRNRMHR